MKVDITSQVEAARGRSRDPRPEDDDRHGGGPSGAPEAAVSGRGPR
jgi:hypothetical protein